MRVRITTRPPKLSDSIIVAPGRVEKPFPWLWVGAGGMLFFGLLAFLGRKIYVDLKNKAEWAKFVFAETTALFPTLPVKSRIIIVAHAAYESGWGQGNRAVREANNLFNVTAGSQWHGDTLVVPNADLSYNVAECTRLNRPMVVQINGKPACRIDQTWRKYASYRDSLTDYWSFLGGRYIVARDALAAGDVAGFVNGLYAKGYFTLAPDEYLNQLASMVDSVAKRLEVTV